MARTKVKTISLQGKQYAQVNERIKALHEDFENVSINTEFTMIWEKGYCNFKATVKVKKWETECSYTGNAFWSLQGVKAYEKLETIAVGRALAFAWYLADWEVASYEEVENFISDKQ